MVHFELREDYPWYTRLLTFLKDDEPPLNYYIEGTNQKATPQEIEYGYKYLNAVGYRVWLAPGFVSNHLLPAAGFVVDLEDIGGMRYVHVEGDDLETHLFNADDFHAKYQVEPYDRTRQCYRTE